MARTRASTILLLCLVVSFNAAFPNALQVGALGPRRQALAPRGRGPVQIPCSMHSSEGPAEGAGGLLSQLHTYTGGAGEAVDYSSGRGGSKSLSLFRLLVLGVILALASKSLPPYLLSLFQSYNRCLTTDPLITKVLTGAVLATFGDALAQAGEKDKPYDSRRAASFAAFDSCYHMFQHVAFPLVIANCQGRVLSSILSAVPDVAVSGITPMLAVCERVLAYQMMVVPLLYYPVFFTFTGFMQGLTMKETFQRAVTNYIPCWKRNLMFWVPVQAWMFSLVPTKWQVAFTCVMGIVWSLKLSVTAGKAKKD